MAGGDPHVLAAALALAERGVPVLGVGQDKRPRVLTTRDEIDESTGEVRKRADWKARQTVAPAAALIRQEIDRPTVTGYGVILGAVAGRALGGGYLSVVDLEAAVSAGRLLDAAELQAGDLPIVRTGGGGRHLWWISDSPVPVLAISDAETGEHLGEVRGEGGYVVAPPSLHPSGNRYAWLSPPKTKPRRVPDLLAYLAPLFAQLGWRLGAGKGKPTDDGEEQAPVTGLLFEDCGQGSRHTTLMRLVGWMRSRGIPRDEALAMCLLWNRDHCKPPQPPDEVVTQVRDGYGRWEEPPRLVQKVRATEAEMPVAPPPVPEECWRGWFGQYRDVFAPSTEAPDAFHLGGALVAASMILGRSCWTRYAGTVFPNLWVVLLGESGRPRKSTALRFVKQAMACPDLVTPNWHVTTSISSWEGFVETLAHAGPTLLRLNELTLLFRASRREGTSNIIPALTDGFDLDEAFTLATRRNAVRCERPFFSVLAATTEAWLSADIREDDIRGGFAGRFLYLSGTGKGPLPNPPEPDYAALHALRAHAHGIARAFAARGGVEVTLAPDAEAWWDRFYREEYERRYVDELATLFQRVALYTRKLGMLYAVMDGATEITAEHFEAGLAVVRLSQRYVEGAHRSWGATLDAKLATKVLALVDGAGGRAQLSMIHQRLSGRVRAMELKAVVQTLVMFGELVYDGDKAVARPALGRRNGTAH